MTEVFSRYDTAEHLRTEEEVALYLEACLENAGNDPAFIAPWGSSESKKHEPASPRCRYIA